MINYCFSQETKCWVFSYANICQAASTNLTLFLKLTLSERISLIIAKVVICLEMK